MASETSQHQPNGMGGTGLANVSLNVGIVGAGIAGLTAAITLRRSGHRIEVRSPPGTGLASPHSIELD